MNHAVTTTVDLKGGSAPEKGDLNKLWNLLQVNFNLDPMERLQKIQSELAVLKQNATSSLAPVEDDSQKWLPFSLTWII